MKPSRHDLRPTNQRLHQRMNLSVPFNTRHAHLPPSPQRNTLLITYAPIPRGQGSKLIQKIGFGIFYDSDRMKILQKEIKYQQNRHQERSRPHCLLQHTPSWWKGEHPSPRTPHFELRIFGPSGLAISVDPHNVVDGSAPMVNKLSTRLPYRIRVGTKIERFCRTCTFTYTTITFTTIFLQLVSCYESAVNSSRICHQRCSPRGLALAREFSCSLAITALTT